MEDFESHYSEKWKLLVGKAFADYSTLSIDEKTWFNVQCLIDAGNNGGLISYYYNSGAGHMDDTLAGLKQLQAIEMYDIITQINQSVFNGDVSPDIDVRNEAIDQINDSQSALLDKLDDQFFTLEEDLQNKLFSFYTAKILGK